MSLDTLNISSILQLIESVLPYILEGLKYTSIITIVCIVIAQFLLHRRESLKI